MKKPNEEAKARQRAEMILKVRSGLMTATEAAKQLGVSRKTYYQWERRALEGMVDSLSNRPPGRPEKPEDPEKDALQARVAALERELALANQSLGIREILLDELRPPGGASPPAGRKKGERRGRVVQRMTDAKIHDRLPYRRQCAVSPVAYSSFKRWKARQDCGELIVRKAGPKKVRPLDLHDLYEKIQRLAHRRRRTHGAGALYRECRHGVSRRDYQRMVTHARREANAAMQEVQWLQPGVIWSLDDSQYGKRGEAVYVHSVQDLGSRHKLAPLAGESIPEGNALADKLQQLFERYGRPLFLKRDNGSNLNHHAVDRLLEDELVIPINSPGYCARYNGGIEHAQGEIKKALRRRIQPPCSVWEAQMAAEAAVHELNHTPRRILKGKTSCELFQIGRVEVRRYTKRRRREIYDWIRLKAARILAAHEGARKLTPATAWRIAAKTWLQSNGVIAVAARNSVTQFPGKKGS